MLVLAALNGCGGTISGDPVTGSGWRSEPPMVSARAAHAVVATPDAIFALAGTNEAGAPVLEVERFDGNRWEVVTTLPGEGRNAAAAVYLEGRIYVIGGFGTITNVPTREVLIYEIANDRWSQGPPLPASRGGHAAVVLAGRIHVFGGGNSISTIADHSMLDPRAGEWVELAPLPTSRGSPAGVVVDGSIWSIGGRSGPADFGDVDIFEPRTNRWTPGPPIPPRGTAGAVFYEGSIYLVGGESQSERQNLADVLRLDPVERVWREAEPLPVARSFARTVFFDDAIFVVGGSPQAASGHAAPGARVVESFRLVPR